MVFVVSAARLKRLREWENSLRKRFEGLRFLRVADVPPSRPPARYEDVAGRLRQHVPREVSVLIDVDRVWATGFEIDPREVNLLVFDGQGAFAGQLSGGPTPERLARVVALVGPLAPPVPGASALSAPTSCWSAAAWRRPDRAAPARAAARAALILLEREARLGGSTPGRSTSTDVAPAHLAWLGPLIAHVWAGYDVRFPGLDRRLPTHYRAITSARLHRGDAASAGRGRLAGGARRR